MEAPGQLLKHYAPYLPCYTVELEDLVKSEKSEIEQTEESQRISFCKATLISFSEDFKKFSPKFKYFLEIG